MVSQKKPSDHMVRRSPNDTDELSFGTHVGAESGMLPKGIKVGVPEGDFALLCSACFQTCAGKDAHVIPWWNPAMRDFFTTFRCEQCWLDSLSETESKIRRLTTDIRFRFCEFLRRHKLDALAAEAEVAPLAKSTELLMQFVAKIRSKEIVLKP